ncbi:response regulator transcription factor [Spongiibacter taiwanensis]|uniref:response regulator n=1 Tax=Spongiibacter taiwanensis TaxID=1748242 RepID=UPI0020351C3C|nr:response regulator transcription factor [Spongiibacter taiwanensis]USA44759.1 response regulator transcription factor [Spongiibacter taiwanensis]
MESILIVEDIPEVRHWLGGVADSAFHAAYVHLTDSVRGAEELMRSILPDLALIDIGLPDGSGIDVIRRIKQLAPNSVCVVTTIFDDSENLFAALKAGADGYLLKDESEKDFSDRLKGIMRGQPPLSPSIARRMLTFFRPTDELGVALTEREKEVLSLIARGYSVKNCAELLGLSHHTVADYVKALYQKLQVNSRAEATLKAIDMGLVSSDSQ